MPVRHLFSSLHDVGEVRTSAAPYEAIIRVNSQKDGIAYLMETKHDLRLPGGLQTAQRNYKRSSTLSETSFLQASSSNPSAPTTSTRHAPSSSCHSRTLLKPDHGATEAVIRPCSDALYGPRYEHWVDRRPRPSVLSDHLASPCRSVTYHARPYPRVDADAPDRLGVNFGLDIGRSGREQGTLLRVWRLERPRLTSVGALRRSELGTRLRKPSQGPCHSPTRSFTIYSNGVGYGQCAVRYGL